MKEDYFIDITSIRKIEESEDKITINTVGTFTCIKNKYYITYKEYDDENPEKYKICIIKAENSGLVTLIKNDVFQTRLILEKGKRHHCPYHTEFGMLMMGIFTNNVDFNFTENHGELYLKYSIDINSIFSGATEITIKIRKKEKTNKT